METSTIQQQKGHLLGKVSGHSTGATLTQICRNTPTQEQPCYCIRKAGPVKLKLQQNRRKSKDALVPNSRTTTSETQARWPSRLQVRRTCPKYLGRERRKCLSPRRPETTKAFQQECGQLSTQVVFRSREFTPYRGAISPLNDSGSM